MEDKVIYIPEKIKVGYQERKGTTEGKLGYVTAIDYKGKQRKKRSWTSWIDESLGDFEYDNKPIKGFKINREVGGPNLGTPRNEYIRVFDPRGYDIEIKVWNLLYILRNTEIVNLEELEFKGEFVYGWEGSELVLIPKNAPDYIEYKKYSDLLNKDNHIRVKDLEVGSSYLTKQKEEFIYVGRRKVWRYAVDGKENLKIEARGKHHVFVSISNYREEYVHTVKLKSLGRRFIKKVTSNPEIALDRVLRDLEYNREFVPLDKSKDKYMKYSPEDIEELFKDKFMYHIRVRVGTGEIVGLNKGQNSYEGKYYLRDIGAKSTFYSDDLEYLPLEELIEKYDIKVEHRYLENGNLYSIG